MRNIIVQLIILACLLIDNIQVSGHQLCRAQKIKTTVITKGCGPQTIVSVGCRGYCPSHAEPRLGQATFDETCTCCKAIKKRTKRVVLCNSPRDERVVAVAKKCICRPCMTI